MASFYVYWIVSGNRSYIGATVNPSRRLRQHNGEIKGGAHRTKDKGPWAFKCVISGFRTWKEALQFEWAFKYYSRRCRGYASREACLTALMSREKWTSNSPLASEIPLRVQNLPTEYGGPPDNYSVKVKERRTSVTTKPARRRKKVHGVSY